jgi:hypothetical protein
MLFNFEDFPGFAAEDFAAFQERKWGSNRFNLERMKVRSKMEALAKTLEEPLEETIKGLILRTTLDHPHIFNQNCVRHIWLYADRPGEERLELSRIVDKELTIRDKVQDSVPEHQVSLAGVGINESGLTCFFRMHCNAVLDRRNLLARLADPAEQQHLAVLLNRLDESYTVTIGDTVNSATAAANNIPELMTELAKCHDWFSVQQTLSVDNPLLQSTSDLSDFLTSQLPSLLDLYRFTAWSRENDRLKLAKTIKEEKRQKAKRLTGFDEGDQVRVVSGLLSGKEGRVQSVDHKGRVKVQFGRLSMEMEPKLLKKI